MAWGYTCNVEAQGGSPFWSYWTWHPGHCHCQFTWLCHLWLVMVNNNQYSNQQSPIRALFKTTTQLWHNKYAFSTRFCPLLCKLWSNITWAIDKVNWLRLGLVSSILLGRALLTIAQYINEIRFIPINNFIHKYLLYHMLLALSLCWLVQCLCISHCNKSLNKHISLLVVVLFTV